MDVYSLSGTKLTDPQVSWFTLSWCKKDMYVHTLTFLSDLWLSKLNPSALSATISRPLTLTTLTINEQVTVSIFSWQTPIQYPNSLPGQKWTPYKVRGAPFKLSGWELAHLVPTMALLQPSPAAVMYVVPWHVTHSFHTLTVIVSMDDILGLSSKIRKKLISEEIPC